MHRRDILRQLFFGISTARALMNNSAHAEELPAEELEPDKEDCFKSKWHLLPNMTWTGEDLWAKHPQDWCIKNGELQCLVHGRDKTVHVLTHQLSDDKNSFTARLSFRFLNAANTEKESFAGFRLGVKGRFEDYRSAIMTGKGMDAGITRNGFLFVGNTTGDRKIGENILTEKIKLVLTVTAPYFGAHFTKLKAVDKAGNTIATLNSTEYDALDWKGNIALVSHCRAANESREEATIAISKFEIEGHKLDYHPRQAYGAIYFVHYALQNKMLKLTVQLAPIDIADAEVVLFTKKDNDWKKTASSQIDSSASTATFYVENWNGGSYTYKIVYRLPLKNGKKKEYQYEGTIAAELQENKQFKNIS
jgi:hypothetical protein